MLQKKATISFDFLVSVMLSQRTRLSLNRTTRAFALPRYPAFFRAVCTGRLALIIFLSRHSLSLTNTPSLVFPHTSLVKQSSLKFSNLVDRKKTTKSFCFSDSTVLLPQATRLSLKLRTRGFASPGHPGFANLDALRMEASLFLLFVYLEQ